MGGGGGGGVPLDHPTTPGYSTLSNKPVQIGLTLGGKTLAKYFLNV